jgi:NAD(P)H-nitrite reductase large subunit
MAEESFNGKKMDCVIVGGGVAGFQAAMTLRKIQPDKSVLIIDAEGEIGYYRTLLPQFMMGTIAESKLFFWKPDDDPMIKTRTGARVRSVDRNEQTVSLESGEIIGYRRLILACGGRPILPAVCPDNACAGVFPVRYLTDARAVKKWVPEHPDTVVLGGGLVGVKTAAHLAHDGLNVTIIEKEKTLLPMALSPETAGFVKKHLERIGIRLELGCSVEDVRAEEGRLKAVSAGGQWVSCETLLIAAGSVPDISFLEGSGLIDDGKLSVSSALQTRDEKIFGLGDAITVKGDVEATPWTWPQAVSQGKLAAMNLFESTPVPLKVTSRVNAMNLFGFSLVILGAPVAGSKTVSYSDADRGIHRELFIMDDRIVGGALVGDISGAGALHSAMTVGERIPENCIDLLKPTGKAFPGRSWEDLKQEPHAVFLS